MLLLAGLIDFFYLARQIHIYGKSKQTLLNCNYWRSSRRLDYWRLFYLSVLTNTQLWVGGSNLLVMSFVEHEYKSICYDYWNFLPTLSIETSGKFRRCSHRDQNWIMFRQKTYLDIFTKKIYSFSVFTIPFKSTFKKCHRKCQFKPYERLNFFTLSCLLPCLSTCLLLLSWLSFYLISYLIADLSYRFAKS